MVKKILQKKSALPSALPSQQQEDLMFIVYGRPFWYEVKAFNKKGEPAPKFCFNIDLSKTLLPHNSGFCSVGPILYIIGGTDVPRGDITVHVSTLDTYQIDFNTISRFPNNELPSDHAQLRYVRRGPPLNGHKQAPILIVLGYKIYVFSRFLHLDDSSHKFELLDTGVGMVGQEQWVGLPEPPFKEDLHIRNVDDFALKIESHVVYEVHSCIIIHVTGSDRHRFYNGVYKFHLNTREWSLLTPRTIPLFGKALPLSGVYYALRDTSLCPNNEVCAFVAGTPAPSAEDINDKKSLPTHRVEIDDVEPPPEKVLYHPRSEIGLLGDTIFLARVGYDSINEATAKHHFILDKFQVTMTDGRAKATNFSRMSEEIKENGSMSCPSTLYCVPWYVPAP